MCHDLELVLVAYTVVVCSQVRRRRGAYVGLGQQGAASMNLLPHLLLAQFEEGEGVPNIEVEREKQHQCRFHLVGCCQHKAIQVLG